MHAVRLHAFGPAENLVHEWTEDPVPGPGPRRAAAGRSQPRRGHGSPVRADRRPSQRFPLAEAAAAHRALETRGTMGKVVLEP